MADPRKKKSHKPASKPAEQAPKKSSKRPMKKARGGKKHKPVEVATETTSTPTESTSTGAVPLAAVFQPADAKSKRTRKRDVKETVAEVPASGDESSDESDAARRRRRGGRRRKKGEPQSTEVVETTDANDKSETTSTMRRRTRKRGEEAATEGGTTRIDSKRSRRRENRPHQRKRPALLSEAEFLARRENVERVMVVREIHDRVQVAVLEDTILVEHYVNRQGSGSLIGNIYLGRVQNVLPSMEAAFVDIGKGRNAVLYAGEVNWDAAGLEGEEKRIEMAFKTGDPVLVQVTKDPIGQKGARLTAQISLPGRFVVYVPDGSMTGISRKLPEKERNRLKSALRSVISEESGVIVRTAAEGASEEDLIRDVSRLTAQWEDVLEKAKTAQPPSLIYSEPDLAIKIVRDIFNEDFKELIISGDHIWEIIENYVKFVAPDLQERLHKWTDVHDIFGHYRIDEQLAKALDRKVWLPSGGSLVIDRTEAMTVVDVNTGKFIGEGGNLEQTVTRNNLEAAEEIVRQLRLRDIGGIIVIDFIDMVLESNRDTVLRRLIECLGRDRTKHQVAEVTSLGLVQMTRKRIGQGLLETFSEPCEHCNARGVKVHLDVSQAKTVLEPEVHDSV